ncbi:MAG: amino acid permease [Chthoniobacteraceae bacterium]
MSTPQTTGADIADDVKLLESMGYKQELKRRMSAFSNFAISLSIICILAGGITSLQMATSAVGGAAAGIIWPLGCIIGLCIAATMAQVASAFPTAGGLYHWSSILGGKGWGWAAAWFNLLGLIFVTAAVNFGVYLLATGIFWPWFGWDPTKLTTMDQIIGVALITGLHALFNHFGIKLTTLLTDFSGWLIMGVAVVLTAAMLIFGHPHDVGRLFTITNYSGDAGGGVWFQSNNLFLLILLALLYPCYTLTGYDASAHTSEETVDAARNVPKGILRSVIVSGIFGWVMVCALVLALPSVADGAKQGGNIFFWLMDQVIPKGLEIPLEILIVIGNFLCGLACVTSTSRMMYAFARDGGLPFSGALKKISATHTVPVNAIWTTAIVVVACTAYAQAYAVLSAVCVIFLYISYLMPAAAGIFAYGKTWTKMGPFNLGGPLYKTLCVLGLIGLVGVGYAGMVPSAAGAPPLALYATVGVILALVITWFAGVRKIFAGPPMLAGEAAAPEPVILPGADLEGA